MLVGGEHQLLHIVPVAAELSRHDEVEVCLFAATARLAATAAELMARLDCRAFRVYVMKLPAWLEASTADNPNGVSFKVLRLLRHAGKLRRCAALVTAERTSTLLKRLPGRCPPMIHLRHGAGDRAVGFEPRIRLFDQLIVAGEKDRRRVIEQQLLPPGRCHATGYIKLAALRQLHRSAAPLFANELPTVFYNPHFRPALSSWWQHGRELIESIRDSGEFNLIFAPHARLFATAGTAERRAWEALAIPDRVLVDLGSSRSYDMTYTLAADIYLGDVSSQVYEFAAEPRPCVFLNSHGVQWRGDPDYLMWEMGEVVEQPAAALAALRHARERHAGYQAVQQHLTADAFGDTGPGCAARAARVILDSIATGH